MLLKNLLKVNSDVSVQGIGYGENCPFGALYFCLRENKLRQDVEFAERSGAVALITPEKVETRLPQFTSKDVRADFALASSAYYGNPSKKLTMIAVTGTNGKTTTTHIIKKIMEADGRKTGMIGTNCVMIDDEVIEPTLTTPDPPVLHELLARMVERGVTTVVMEVSAHALALKKLSGIKFTVSAFTNLTQDHLDFFGNMNAYANAKSSLFTPELSACAVVNVDDEMGMEILRNARIPVVTYGFENPSDAFGIEYRANADGCRFVANIMDDILELKYCAPGAFNMCNVLCAATVAKTLGVDSLTICKGVQSVKSISGRFEIVKGKGKRVVVDYAHTPDGLKKILGVAREITKGKIITVFGCGGNRDKGKRAIMGEIASELSDFAVITSDNPRDEDPTEIAQSVASGCKKPNYKIITDRRAGIAYALELCGENDTVIVAGKGHENTQEAKGVKTHFSDVETVKELLE